MVTERRTTFPRISRLAWLRPCLLVTMVASASPPAVAADAPIRLIDASERGTFNVGAAQASLGVSSDPNAGDVLKFDYTLPPGTAAGVWAKTFPEGMDAANVDVVRPMVRAADPGKLSEIAVALEIKGTAGTQRIPLELHLEWTPTERTVDWKAVGELKEIVVSVSRSGDGGPVLGTIDLDIRFEHLPWLRKLGMMQVTRFGGVVLTSVVVALGMALLSRLTGREQRTAPALEGGEVTRRRGLIRNFIQGTGTVFIAALAIRIYLDGGVGPLEVGWSPVWMAIAGGVIAEWWKFGLTGKHLTPWESFRDSLATGLLAAASSSLAILQAPSNWSQMLMLSQPVAAVVAILYHAANAGRLASTGKHLSAITGAMIVGAPFAVGGLTLLESGELLRTLGDILTAHTLADRFAVSEFVGRVIVLFAFNELAAAALGMATKRTMLRSVRGHLALFAVAVAAVAGPGIAAYGSGAEAASWRPAFRMMALVASTVLSQAGLWAEGYLLTGMVLDAIGGQAPSHESAVGHPLLGMKKGMIYSGTFMSILSIVAMAVAWPVVQSMGMATPLLLGAIVGALAFPMVKTIIETFDGSQAFFQRVAKSYRDPTLYVRGIVVGLGLAYGLSRSMEKAAMIDRVGFGFLIGVAAFSGINLLRDILGARAGRASVRPSRAYLVEAMLGGFIGAAIGFYLDTVQVGVVVEKFHRYVDPNQPARPFGDYLLLSKWGFIGLGTETGGASLLFAEALAGVIIWSIPSWLFAINRTFMSAYFDQDVAPIKAIFTRRGVVQLVENMIAVLRWGLWMSPIIKTFLRPMGEPTWYNQDGAIRTVVATFHDFSETHQEFRAWSLGLFTALLAHDWVRIVIWLDHFGLRVSTLVNLSFLGMDRLDRRLSRFLAPASTARCIPEAVKRFTTWAPLLIPFYIPRDKDWDLAWNRSQTILRGEHGGLLSWLSALPSKGQLLVAVIAVVLSTSAFALVRRLKARSGAGKARDWSLANPEYEVMVKLNGEVYSFDKTHGYDLTRRSYDRLDPAGRALFLVDATGDPPRSWPLIGNVPNETAEAPRVERSGDAITVQNTHDGIRASVAITLPNSGDPVELWTITLENLTETTRRIKVAPYLEWVLNRPDADRGHTQYNRLFAEVEYVSGLHAVLAWDKHSKALGLLASDVAPEGFLSSRMDFIGRARSLGDPRVLETLAFTEARDTDSHPTFDPIGSLLLGVTLPARGSTQIRLLIGFASNKRQAIDLIARHLAIPGAASVAETRTRKTSHPIRHGEIPPETPQPYTDFADDGRSLIVHTPFTTRPFDHTMANALGHVVVVTNRGLHTTSSVNAQQNRLTPDWSDTVTKEVPSEAFFLFDPNSQEWFSPTYHPLNDPTAAYESEFGVDGTATFRMAKGEIETELTVFVPPDDPLGIYRLTIRNHAETSRRLRVASYDQMVLAGQPEFAGPLKIRADSALNAVFFENPRNTYRTGPAFVSLSGANSLLETSRGRFFGDGRGLAHPAFVSLGAPYAGPTDDDRPVAAFLTEVEVPAGGEQTISVLMGQADDRDKAEAVIRKYRDPEAVQIALEETRRWWLSLMETVTVETNHPEFDRYLDWLKYQALAERIWARRGFYQASGAFGFRDQLQDAVNLIWVDPSIARRQILLHASQQFLEGDVVHWFHLLQDGRTGFVGRTHASDNLLWLAWGVVEYLGATGDESLLDERTAYLESDLPFEPLPAGKQGMGFDPLRSSRVDSVYRHCMRAIDLVLDKRMGVHGLPLMGTGDWNDGLDEIGSQGKGESVWLGFFLSYILDRMIGVIESKDGPARAEAYRHRLQGLREAIEGTWRGDRYLRAFHDDGTEIGVKGSGIWEIDALTAAWAVMAGINPERGRIVFETALETLEQEKTILLGWPPLREDTKPYLGRSSGYPEGVRENGMYCHGVQWLVGAARLLAQEAEREGRPDDARRFRDTAVRLWWKISAIPHAVTGEIETYGGQPNQQAADMVTTFEPGRMIWNGYTGAAGWMFRQALEGVLGLRLDAGKGFVPAVSEPAGDLILIRFTRDLSQSPFGAAEGLRPSAQSIEPELPSQPV